MFQVPQTRTKCRRVELTWYDGVKNLPPLPDQFGEAVVDANIPPPSSGKIDTKASAPGKVIYGEGLTFKGGSHGTTLKIIPESKAKDMASKLPAVPKSPSNHFANFLLACKGEEKCRSSFAVAGPLSQVMVLGCHRPAPQRPAQVRPDHETNHQRQNRQRPARRPAAAQGLGAVLQALTQTVAAVYDYFSPAGKVAGFPSPS